MHFLVVFPANDQLLRIQVPNALDLLVLCIVKIYGSFRLQACRVYDWLQVSIQLWDVFALVCKLQCTINYCAVGLAGQSGVLFLKIDAKLLVVVVG